MQLKINFKILFTLLLFTFKSFAGEFKEEKKYTKEANWYKKEAKEPVKLWKPLEEMTKEDFSNLRKQYGSQVYYETRNEFLKLKLTQILNETKISTQSEQFLKNNFYALENKHYYSIKPYFIYAWARLQNEKGISKSALLILERLPNKAFPADIASEALLLKGLLQLDSRQYNSARNSIIKASKAKGKMTSEMRYLLGLIDIIEGRETIALDQFKLILKETNDTSLLIKSYNQIAICHINNGNIDQSVQNYKKAIQLKGVNEQSLVEYLKISQSYFQQKNYEKSEEFIDKYKEGKSFRINSPDEIEILKSLSFYLDSIGSSKKSLELLQLHSQLTDSIIEGSQMINELYQIELLAKEKAISENAINNLVKEDQLKEDALKSNKIAIWLLLGLLVVGLGAVVYILRVSKQRSIANQKLALRSLRSQMNPHFIFNALNSVNSFISENDQRSANKFLTSFSRLMRLVMENSEHDFIPLQKELEILEIYLQLEHFRFKDQFTYQVNLDESIDEDEFHIPPMLIQPYIENAVWHGLRYMEDSGFLKLGLELKNQNLIVTIMDNGIGRAKSEELKTVNQKKNKSTALRNIKERTVIIKELHGLKIDVKIDNLNEDGTGTIVQLIVPQKKTLS